MRYELEFLWLPLAAAQPSMTQRFALQVRDRLSQVPIPTARDPPSHFPLSQTAPPRILVSEFAPGPVLALRTERSRQVGSAALLLRAFPEVAKVQQRRLTLQCAPNRTRSHTFQSSLRWRQGSLYPAVRSSPSHLGTVPFRSRNRESVMHCRIPHCGPKRLLRFLAALRSQHLVEDLVPWPVPLSTGR